MLHLMGYEGYCAECEKPCKGEDIADFENGICHDCCAKFQSEQEDYWRPLYEGEKRAGLLPLVHYKD